MDLEGAAGRPPDVLAMNSSLTADPNSTSLLLLQYLPNSSFLDYDYDLAFPRGGHNGSAAALPEWFDDLGFEALANASSPPNASHVNPSYAAYERFMVESRHWVQRVLVPLVMCVGVVGNSVSMVVLTRRRMRTSTNNYLTALAISDLLYLVFVFSLSLQHHPDIKHPRHWFYWQYFRYGLWLTDASSKYIVYFLSLSTLQFFSTFYPSYLPGQEKEIKEKIK